MERVLIFIVGLAVIAGVVYVYLNPSIAFAQVSAGVGANVEVTSQVGGRASSTVSDDRNEHASSTDDSSVRANASTTGRGESTGQGEEHRSGIAAQVEALLSVADRDGGIGKEVSVVAHEVASTSQSTEAAKAEVESRPGWLTFLFGSDYGNLGTLRSDIVKTHNQIERLSAARDRTTDASVKAELAVEIAALQASASTTATFVSENESQFSLFGWLVRLFD